MKFPPLHLTLMSCAAALAPLPAHAASLLDYVGQCVPFARAASGIQIYGDAWTWWGQAAGKYQRGSEPRIGAVIVFAKTARLPLGHVGVISRIVDKRVALITQANWSVIDGERGHAEQDVTLFDVSKDNDWSEVRVWYKGMDGLGSSTYPIYGFIYGTPAADAPDTVRKAKPAPQLTSRDPDYVGALIDAYAPTWTPPKG
jgi:surface antigen